MPTPGLTLTNQTPVESAATVALDDSPPSEIWNRIATTDSFRDALETRVRELIPDDARPGQYAGILYDVGVTAANGAYARVVASLYDAITPPHADDDDDDAGDTPHVTPADPVEFVYDVTAEFGAKEAGSLGFSTDLEDVRDGPLAVFDAPAEENLRTPTVAIVLEESFTERRADQRRTICRLLADLASVTDLRVHATGRLQRWLADTHRDDLPGGVSEQCNTGREQAGPAADLSDLRATVDPDGREVWLLRQLENEATETLSYSALRSRYTGNGSRVRQVVATCREYGLVDTYGPTNDRKVELLPHGGEFLSQIDREVGRQATLENAVSQPQNSVQQYPCKHADSRGGGTGPGAADAAADREATPRRRTDDLTQVEYLDRWNHVAAVGAAPENGVGLVDYPIPERENRDAPAWSYDPDADRLVVSAEWDNPLAFWVRIALALADYRTFDRVLTPERLDGESGDLGGLEVSEPLFLRDTRCLGYLSGADYNGDSYAEALQAAAEHLRELTRKLAAGEYDDEARFRGAITREALGLTGTMVHLLDLAGVDVVRECRIPQTFSRSFNPKRRATLVRSIATGAAIQSRFEQFAAYRQLFEGREEKRRCAISPTVDANDPFGQLIGSFVIVGDGVSKIEEALTEALKNPGELHEDAPEFAVPIPVRTETPRTATARAAQAMCGIKNLSVTRDAVSVIRAFTDTPYDASAALHALSPEDEGRDIRVDEVQYALATLPQQRIFPDGKPTESAILHTLLGATEPLSQATLCDRADISSQSFRNYRDVLEALGLLMESPHGWRLCLPLADSERGAGADAMPWYATPDTERDDMREATPEGVLYEVFINVDQYDIADPPAEAFIGTAEEILAATAGVWTWVDRWRVVLDALTPVDERIDTRDNATEVAFGISPTQTSLQAAADGRLEAPEQEGTI